MTDLELMKSPADWPNWPILPVKNKLVRDASNFPEIGIMIDSIAWGKAVFKMNMWEIKKELANNQEGVSWLQSLPHTKFDSYEEIIEAGWEVD